MHQSFICRDGKNTIHIPAPDIARARIDYRSMGELIRNGALRTRSSLEDLTSCPPSLIANVEQFIFSANAVSKTLGIWAEHLGHWFRVATLVSSWHEPYTAYCIACSTLPELTWRMEDGITRADLHNGSTLTIGINLDGFNVGGQYPNCRSPYNPDPRRDVHSLPERLLAQYALMLDRTQR